MLSGTMMLSAPTFSAVDFVKVDKSKRRLYLIENDQVIREFRIALGKNPKGHKIQEGDNRTPEGSYHLDFIIENSDFYRSIHISYPNDTDRETAKMRGVDPGGDIKIHGLKNEFTRPPLFIQSFDWTNGCIALTNEELDEFLSLVEVGTPIHIQW